ncbi:hypothetical protein FPQ18DRAFT_27228 [Pyronema domesticum]|nr:hypothetical protein FPQ18DRAFT_27228 [Pyronema domesticum]
MEDLRAMAKSIARVGLRASVSPISVTAANADFNLRRNGNPDDAPDAAPPSDPTGDGCHDLNHGLSAGNHEGLRNADDEDDTMDDFDHKCAAGLNGDNLPEAVSTNQWGVHTINGRDRLFKLRTDIPDFETEEELHTFMLQEVRQYQGERIQHRQDQTTHPWPSETYSISSNDAAGRYPQWAGDYQVQDVRGDLRRQAGVAKTKIARGHRCCQAHELMVGRGARS